MMVSVSTTTATNDEKYFSDLVATWCPGRSLAREFYTSPRVFERDIERVYLRHWTFVAHASRLAKPGDYFLNSLAGESVIFVQFFPINWFVANNDYAMLVRFSPLAVLETEIEVTWLVHQSAVEGHDYDLADITWLWSNTLREDKKITEDNQAGVNSRFYRPGPHSREENLDEFIGWYLAQIR